MSSERSEGLNVDVAVLGGGLAGNLLARQLRMYVPNASVALFERSHERSWKVGEASVEIAANYLMRRQRLSMYMYENHLPKNGLRFFFDNETKDLPITEMSEMGSDELPSFPSFQIDRARLEGDLLEMNRGNGCDVRMGYAARDLVLGEEGAPHRFVAVGENDQIPVTAKWVVDATGRASVIARQKQLHVPVGHEITASWARFKNVYDIDAHPDEAWRGAVRNSARFLSTIHYCYPGYWIWFIPLKNGVMSVGVVIERSKFPEEFRGEEGFMKFLKQHKAVWKLLEKAELLDFMSFKQLAYGTKQFFSTDRWATIGDAAAFTDPFYSPGSDFISMENDFVTDVIGRDLAGEPKAEVDERTRVYDEFMRHRYDATLLLYENQYPFLGSYELMRAKFFFDVSGYYNHWLRPYLRDEHLDLGALKKVLAGKEQTIAVMKTFYGLMAKAEKALRDKGKYYRLNSGDRATSFDVLVPFANTLAQPIAQSEVDDTTAWILGTSFGWVKDLIRLGPARTAKELTASHAPRVKAAIPELSPVVHPLEV